MDGAIKTMLVAILALPSPAVAQWLGGNTMTNDGRSCSLVIRWNPNKPNDISLSPEADVRCDTTEDLALITALQQDFRLLHPGTSTLWECNEAMTDAAGDESLPPNQALRHDDGG